MDVCPNPTDRICRGCGAPNPDELHTCTPNCDLCGGNYLAADKVYKARFKMPYLVRKRQWERRNANDTSPKPPSHHVRRDQLRQGTGSALYPMTTGAGGAAAVLQGGLESVVAGGRRRKSRSRSKTRGQAPAKNATKQVGWADRSQIDLSSKDFPRRPLSNTPKKDCEECAQPKALIVRQNQQISALLARIQALEKSKSSEVDTKRKIVKRDAQVGPPAMAMEAEKMESRPLEEPAWAQQIQALPAIVTQLTSQLGLVTSRMAKFETP
ncbi:hypothetical protein HPB48_023307 [Haemaphysalis longicornis]|uniref:Uncharacterized protein n=1 Tax=Haemaphysalis longicornis TaxID=44386 RepID=A0A9J6H5Y8_HAELO|nr:hypothetical protein HPB48_023307 [Haemaphysalis longicornis]